MSSRKNEVHRSLPLEVTESGEDEDAASNDSLSPKSTDIVYSQADNQKDKREDDFSAKPTPVEAFLEDQLQRTLRSSTSRRDSSSSFSSSPLASRDVPGDLSEGQRLATIGVLQKLLAAAKATSSSSSSGRSGWPQESSKSSTADKEEAADEVRKKLRAWQGHCEVLTKERNAVQTIMEGKIALLVDRVSSSVADLLKNASGGGASRPDSRYAQAVQKVAESYIYLIQYNNCFKLGPHRSSEHLRGWWGPQ